MSVFQPTNTDEWIRQQTKEVGRLGRRGRGATVSGVAAARDNLYPVPTTLAERVALANRQIRWFNTEQGWWESYYTVTAEAGLTVQGLRVGSAPGWYPMRGSGPRRRIVGAGGQARSPGLGFTNWTMTGGDTLNLGSGASQITAVAGNAALQLPMAGEYDITWRMAQQAGAGTAMIGVYRYAGASIGWYIEEAIPLNGTYATYNQGVNRIVGTPGAQYGLAVQVGTLSIGGVGPNFALLELAYTSPPFAS